MTSIIEVQFTRFTFVHDRKKYELSGDASYIGLNILEIVAASNDHINPPRVITSIPELSSIDPIYPNDIKYISASKGVAYLAVLLDLTTYQELGID